MTYAQFLILFLLPPIVVLAWLLRGRMTRPFCLAVFVLAAVALVYTTPWDHYLIASGVWRYPAGRVLGLRIGRVPVEECAFYVLQVVLTGLITLAILSHRSQQVSRR